MDRSQHAMQNYETGPEIVAPYQGIEVVNNSGDKYYVTSGYHQKLPASETVSPKPRICGLSRAIFLLAVALSILAIGVIGLGVGLGVALNKAQATDGYNAAPTESTSQAPITSPSPTATSASSASVSDSVSTPSLTNTVSSTSTSSASSKPSNICPDADNTVIRPTLGDLRYRVACDSDFSGSGKQTLASFFAPTWDDCLALCNNMNYFQERADIGCTWNVAGTGRQTPGTCWCLGGADKTVVSNKGNVVAVPL